MSPHSRQRSGRIPAEPYPLRERFDVSESGCGLGGLAVHCLCGAVRTALRIVKRAAFQHGHENREKSISHPTQSTSVLVPHTTQLRIVLPAVVVMLHADSRPNDTKRFAFVDCSSAASARVSSFRSDV